jgi:polyisoprenoid-binding protein YceI
MEKNMKRYLLILLCLITLPAFAAVETYKLDPNHTYVHWRASHLGFSYLSGKWKAQGTLQLDKENPKNDKVDVTIHIADMITGDSKLNDHLQSDEFFNVAKFPTATFVSDKVDVTGSKTANVKGILTLHGVSKPVTLKVTLNKVGKSPLNDKMTVGFSATTHIKRSDFGMTSFLPMVGDEVALSIEAEASVTN